MEERVGGGDVEGTVGGAMACDRNGTCTEMIVTLVMEMACEMQVTCTCNGVVCDR